jgi:hypothetical protein
MVADPGLGPSARPGPSPCACLPGHAPSRCLTFTSLTGPKLGPPSPHWPSIPCLPYFPCHRWPAYFPCIALPLALVFLALTSPAHCAPPHRFGCGTQLLRSALTGRQPACKPGRLCVCQRTQLLRPVLTGRACADVFCRTASGTPHVPLMHARPPQRQNGQWDPVTRQPLTRAQLVPNQALRLVSTRPL